MWRISLVFGIIIGIRGSAGAQQASLAVSQGPEPSAVKGSGYAGAPAEARYYRLICLVHLTGTGKQGDPIRPEFVPSAAIASREGILGWSVQLTDDKNMAIVHLVAANRKAFDAILNDRRPDIRVFEIGKNTKESIEAELKKYKRDFSLADFRVAVQ